MLQVKDISLIRSGKKILDQIAFQVGTGTLTAILGPNGAGKSSLLNIIAGSSEPDSGSVLLADKALGDWKSADLARHRAFLPQFSTLSFPFTCREVVLMGRTPHIKGIESARDYEIADDALKAVDMTAFSDHKYTILSGGEKQRIQTARILAQIWEGIDGQPRFLLLDEPTAGLDLEHRFQILSLAAEWKSREVTILAILHDLNLAAQYADHILLLDKGRQIVFGTPQEVLTPAVLEPVFRVRINKFQDAVNGKFHLSALPNQDI